MAEHDFSPTNPAPAGPASVIAGLILAGGQGLRGASADKALMSWRGEPLVSHVARRLAPQVGSLIVSVSRNARAYEAFGAVVEDDPALGADAGPLAGISAGLAAWQGHWLACVPCDTPLLPDTLVARLVGAAHAAGAPVAVATCMGRRHAACLVLRGDAPAVRENLARFLQGGDRKIARWQDQAGCVEVSFDDTPASFLNLNSAEDFAFAQS